jgi:hypothetical protein
MHYTSPRTMLVVSAVSLSLATITVFLRFVGRASKGLKIWADDWLVLAGLVCKLRVSNRGSYWKLLEFKNASFHLSLANIKIGTGPHRRICWYDNLLCVQLLTLVIKY